MRYAWVPVLDWRVSDMPVSLRLRRHRPLFDTCAMTSLPASSTTT